MAEYIYLGENNKYHDKETKEVFVNGKAYELSDERLAEVTAVTGDVFKDAENYDAMTVAQLKDYLTENGIEFTKDDKKADLIKLAKGE